MAFENVNVTSLRSAINSCKETLSKTTIQELVNNISDPNVWQADAQKKLKKALNTLSDNRYSELENKLNEYLKIADDIEKYQTTDSNNASLSAEYSNLSKKLYYTETYVVEDIDSNGNKIQRECTRKVKDRFVQRQMNSIQKKINDNKDTMESLKNNILNSL